MKEPIHTNLQKSFLGVHLVKQRLFRAIAATASSTDYRGAGGRRSTQLANLTAILNLLEQADNKIRDAILSAPIEGKNHP